MPKDSNDSSSHQGLLADPRPSSLRLVILVDEYEGVPPASHQSRGASAPRVNDLSLTGCTTILVRYAERPALGLSHCAQICPKVVLAIDFAIRRLLSCRVSCGCCFADAAGQVSLTRGWSGASNDDEGPGEHGRDHWRASPLGRRGSGEAGPSWPGAWWMLRIGMSAICRRRRPNMRRGPVEVEARRLLTMEPWRSRIESTDGAGLRGQRRSSVIGERAIRGPHSAKRQSSSRWRRWVRMIAHEPIGSS